MAISIPLPVRRLLHPGWRLAALMLVALAMLAGCSTTPTVRSEVTSFHESPPDFSAGSFTFTRTAEQDNNLEHRSYEALVSEQLQRLGFKEASPPQPAAFKVAMEYSIQGRDVRVVEPVYTAPYYGPGWGPYFGPRWRYPGFYSPFYDPFYDPYWYGPVQMMDHSYVLYTRQLRITIARTADSRQVFNVKVVSQGTNGSLPAVMPYLVQSAFTDFPGPSGVPRRIDLEMRKD